jgi:peptidyl-dipeptidase Dcp
MTHADPQLAPLLSNPLLCEWQTPFGMPPFGEIRAEHFAPAFEVALAADRAEIDAIAHASAPPDFANTYAALDRCGRLLSRVGAVFWNLASSETSPSIQAIELDLAPKLAAHDSATYLNAALFARLDAVWSVRHKVGLNPEALRLVERVHLDFVLAGARLDPDAKARMAAISERLATLSTQFNQNVLADESGFQLVLQTEADLAGLSDSLRAAARSAAEERGVDNAWVITLSRSLIVPFLTQSTRRDLREQAFKAWTARGDHAGPNDNKPIAREILALRNEQARLMGYTNYADYALADRMAQRPKAVADLLARVWEPAKAKAQDEATALTGMARSLGHDIQLEPWDWRFYAEKVRAARYDFDESAIKPYFSLDAIQAAAFDCATQLFGITFTPRSDLPVYHPDVRAFEVRSVAGEPVGVFLADHFARPTKRGGAWMSSYRNQSRHNGAQPIIVNNNNFAKAPAGEPTLLSFDDAKTLFHEFGHGLHGLLSSVHFERLSGTSVLRDFVELPSQIYEHWLSEDEVLARHARHYATGEPIPAELLARLKAARSFNQGFETVEYTACALVDMAIHGLDDPSGVDIAAFEAAELARIGMPREIVMRHRLPHFMHLFSGAYYAAGYYVYMWAEVLDADGFEAFKEAGSPFAKPVAERLQKFIYASGNTLEPGEAYRAFRGRDPQVEPMLRKRGLVAA